MFPSSTDPSGTAPTASTSLLSSVDPGGSSVPADPPGTTTTEVKTSTQPTLTTSDPVTTTLPVVVTSTEPNAPPVTSFSTTEKTVTVPDPSTSPPPATTPLTPSPTTRTLTSTIHTHDTSTSTSVQLTTVTTVFTTTLSNGLTTTVSSTIVQTGTLSTNTPGPSSFTRHTGVIVAVALSATFALILIAVLVFFVCRRYKARRNNNASMEDILAMAREVAWRPPLDDDDSYLAGDRPFPSQPNHRPPGGQEHNGQVVHDGQGGISTGNLLSAEGGQLSTAPMINPTFGGQPYMPGFERNLPETCAQPEPIVTPVHEQNEEPGTSQVWWGINDPQAVGDDHPTSGAGNRSAASLTMVGGSSSSGGHGGGSSGEHNWRTTALKRNSSGPKVVPALQVTRYSSIPQPVSIASRDPTFDHERQSQEHDKNGVKGFLSRLRTGKRMSTQSVATVRPSSQGRGLHDSDPLSAAPNLFSPSLLNPPMAMPPSDAHLGSPHGVTGYDYASLSIRPPQNSSQDEGLYPYPSARLWPPVTLPSAPSPSPSDDSSMVEGLLHPRLGQKLGPSRQASATSLRDHEDYTRPINGLVNNNNHLRSTTTFETQHTTGF
ncbi:hypothetical protein GALMADRAFT_232408 [Galerina marginata CBS 339.88]|uniref:Uncharacterized protein n=1 Tax=Galerina marginata (strain CBS 339.88) TaxID=685588 RepID=A0A067S6W4_GALM3|nr:hypothetical protein GALMADRAFT_232408 [Galerina marginata CBS 339.88]